MDLVIHAAAFGLGVKRADIKMPWEREPLNPVFAKKPRLIQPPVFVPAVPPEDAEISIPVAEAQGVLRWSKTTSLTSLAYCARQSIGKSTGVMENIVMDNLSGSAVGRQIEEALRGDFDAKTIERSVSDALEQQISGNTSCQSLIDSFLLPGGRKGWFQMPGFFQLRNMRRTCMSLN